MFVQGVKLKFQPEIGRLTYCEGEEFFRFFLEKVLDSRLCDR